MAYGSSSRILLVLVAALGIAIGAACNKRARAQGTPGDQVDETTVGEPEPTEADPNTGGGPIEPAGDAGYDDPLEDEEGLIDEGGEEPGEDDEGLLREGEDEGDPDVPDSEEDLSEQPSSSGRDQPGSTDEGNSSPDHGPAEESEEDAPVHENWSTPVRGSGGDNPPDFVGTAEPTLV